MALAIPAPERPDPREALYKKLANAPAAHAEALLDGYEVLQLARDKGLLELAKGALGSGEKLMTQMTEIIGTDEVISLTRNLVIVVKILASLNPQMLEDIEKAVTKNANIAKAEKPPGLLHLLRAFLSAESRRFMGLLAAILQILGHNLQQGRAQSPAILGKTRKKTTRHN
jgi:uncharacterized protein YjgD (DUF1641 family)